MANRVHTREAPTLKDLLDQVDAATYLLGLDALWTGHEDGHVYIWRKDKKEGLRIKPSKIQNPDAVRRRVVK